MGHYNKKILILAYLFPPLGGSGALRPLKLSKFMPEYGWDPVIVTVKNADWYYAKDPQLLKELPAAAVVLRSAMVRAGWVHRLLNPFRVQLLDSLIKKYLMHPDEQIGWAPFAYRTALKAIRQHDIQAIYSTSGPLSCHLVALWLKRKLHIPWIAEFRDEWFEAPNLELPTALHEKLHLGIERKIAQEADYLVAMAPLFCRLLHKHGIEAKKCVTITGGFDRDDYPEASPAIVSGTENGRFHLVFTGLVYDSFQPDQLLTALSELIQEGMIDPQKIKIEFVGNSNVGNPKKFDVDQICEVIPFLPRKEVNNYLKKATVLLLLLSERRGTGIIPTKTFDYMATGKPILALVPPDGAVADIIRKTGTGTVVNFEDVKGIKSALYRYYQKWEDSGTIPTAAVKEEVARYDQRKITRKFCALLN